MPEGTEITHIVMDRPLAASLKLKKCEYVQPQYIADCANNIHLLPTAAYKPGIPPPAHLSPFVDGKKEGYMPRREQEIRMLKGEEVVVDESSEDEASAEEDKPAAAAPSKKQAKATERQKDDADSSSGDDESDEEEDTAKTKADIAKAKQERAKANKKLKEDLEKERKEMGKVLMTNKQRKLYQQAADEVKEKRDNVKKLKVKRKAIEKRK